MTAVALMVAATFAVLAFTYLVGLFLFARWAKGLFVPLEATVQRVAASGKQMADKGRQAVENGRKNAHEKSNGGTVQDKPASNESSQSPAVKQEGGNESEGDKMKKDIARSLK